MSTVVYSVSNEFSVRILCFLPSEAKSMDRAPVSLGYLVHVVHLLSVILEKPLRFPPIAFGSHSAVRDDVLLEEGGMETRE